LNYNVNKPLIVLDADGVLLDLNEAWRRQAEIILNKTISLQSNCFEMTSRYALSPKEEEIVWENLVWYNFPPIPTAVNAIKALINSGFSLHVVTAIAFPNHQSRKEDLVKLGVKVENIHCVGFNESKIDALTKLSPIAFVDDRLKYVSEASKENITNIYYFNHGYIDVPVPKGDYACITSWDELLPKLLALKS